MKPSTKERMQKLLSAGAVRVTSKDELAAVYGDAGAAADRDFGVVLPVKGRPKAGAKRTVTVSKTIKHTDAFWKAMAKKAKARGLTLHEAMRDALAKWVVEGGQ